MGGSTGKHATFGSWDKYAQNWMPLKKNWPKKGQKNDTTSTTATVTTSPSTAEPPQRFSDHQNELSAFMASDISTFTQRVPAVMQNFDYGNLVFNANSATIAVNSEDSDISSNEEYCRCENNDEDNHMCEDDNKVYPVCKDTIEVYFIDNHLWEEHKVTGPPFKEAKIA